MSSVLNYLGRKAQEDKLKGIVDPDTFLNFQGVLDKNIDKNFVGRLNNPEVYPVINNSNGSYSTHRMSSGEVDGKNIAYPTIVYDYINNNLNQLSDKDAMDYALKNKEYIEFGNSREAEDFANNLYKNVPSVLGAMQKYQRRMR